MLKNYTEVIHNDLWSMLAYRTSPDMFCDVNLIFHMFWKHMLMTVGYFDFHFSNEIKCLPAEKYILKY